MNRVLKFFGSNAYTRITSMFILVVFFATLFNQQLWHKEKVIDSDVKGYYAYLPALFIHKDLKFENLDVYKTEKGMKAWFSEDEKGRRFVKYSTGMSIVYSPFFFAAHGITKIAGGKADGYSWGYHFAIAMCAFTYLVIGIIFLSRFLLRYFKDHIVALVLLIIYLGTNLFSLSTASLGYSHGFSFALISMFMYFSVKWIEQPSRKSAIWIGITGGLMVLIRPVDIIFLLFLPLIECTSFSDIKARFQLFFSHWKHLLWAALFALLIWVPQFLYFEYIFGELIHYSYSKEGFFFAQPQLFNTLFSYRNGWLVYTPIMIFALMGVLIARKHKPFVAYTVPTFVIYVFVISSWWCWWYVGFGNRAFINLYPLLSLPLAVFLSFVLHKHWLIKNSVRVLLLVGICLNLFQSYQFKEGVIHFGNMTKSAYWDAFLRTEVTELAIIYQEQPDYEEHMHGNQIVSRTHVDTIDKIYDGFEWVDNIVQNKHVHHGKQAAVLSSPGDSLLFTSFAVPSEATNVYITAWVKNAEDLVLNLASDEPSKFYHFSSEVIAHDGDWEKIHLYAILFPDVAYDDMHYFFTQRSKKPCYIDDLTIHFFNTFPEKVSLD